MFSIEINDAEVTIALRRLAEHSDDMTPAMREIGEYLTDSTKRRFAKGISPDGKQWAPNTQTTLDVLLHRRKGGTSRRRGEDVGIGGSIGNKKPLIGESKRLGTEIHYRATSAGVTVGSSLVYSAVQQLGAKKGAFGKTKRGASIPWGNIPARPYLGFSDEDRINIMDIIAEHMDEVLP